MEADAQKRILDGLLWDDLRQDVRMLMITGLTYEEALKLLRGDEPIHHLLPGYMVQLMLAQMIDWETLDKNHHVKREIEKLQALGCGELVSPEYYANGITLQDSIRKRINDWILEQINAGNGVEVVDIVHRPATFGKYVRFGVFAFRVYSRAFRVHGIRGFFISTVQNLQDTPADDLQPIADQALMDRAGRFLQQQE
ncbi:hypothetical protein PHMEG_0008671 [Phytophthora megakarya]|uniref:Uncharacterized protein n=1 Tax=Phytophthora megakarya TaxID=4795 RepID=A0A225WI54_9STRA|nr:hypothetical protein PHMEG_0008671 [Phytophthora megakarya]